MEQFEMESFELDTMLSDEVGANDQVEFKIDNDLKAEWALGKIAKTRSYYARLKANCDAMIEKYQAVKKKLNEQESGETAYLELLLHQYFDTVEHRKLKASEVYDLPSGKLVMKSHQPKFKADDTAFVSWMKKNGWSEYVKTVEKPDWGAFKIDHAVLHDGKLYDDNGVEVEGMAVEKVPDTFEVIGK